jgi:hypothetical protein
MFPHIHLRRQGPSELTSQRPAVARLRERALGRHRVFSESIHLHYRRFVDAPANTRLVAFLLNLRS